MAEERKAPDVITVEMLRSGYEYTPREGLRYEVKEGISVGLKPATMSAIKEWDAINAKAAAARADNANRLLDPQDECYYLNLLKEKIAVCGAFPDKNGWDEIGDVNPQMYYRMVDDWDFIREPIDPVRSGT